MNRTIYFFSFRAVINLICGEEHSSFHARVIDSNCSQWYFLNSSV